MPSFVGAGTLVDNGTATSITVTKPAGLAAGHFVIVTFEIVTQSSVIISPPDNSWYEAPTKEDVAAGDNIRIATYYHVATGSEPVWTFILGSSTRVIGCSVAYSGVGSIDVCGLSSGTASPIVAPQGTTKKANDTVICIAVSDTAVGGSAISLDPALTTRANLTTGDTKMSIAIGDGPGPGIVGQLTNAYSSVATTQAWLNVIYALSESGSVQASISNLGIVPGASDTRVTTGTSIDATVPPSIQNGDILVAFFRAITTAGGGFTPWNITVPAGWTKVREDFTVPTGGAQGIKAGVYTHVVTDFTSEPATYTWSVDNNTNLNSMTVDMIAIRGVTGIDASSFALTNGPTSTVNISGVAATQDNQPIIIYAGWGAEVAFTDLVSLQAETQVSTGHQIWSALGGTSGTTFPTKTITDSGSPNAGVIVYELSFLTSKTQIPKLIGSTVINRYSAVSSIAIATPGNILTGDLLVAHVVGPTGGTITPPAGWTAIPNALADDGNFSAQAFTHINGPGDPTSVTFAFSGSTTGFASITAYRNIAVGGYTATNSTVFGQTPGISSKALSLILMFQTIANNVSPNGNPMGYQQETFLTPFVYNPNSRNGGNINRGGVLSVFLQSGADGGQIGRNYRSASGNVTGPQLTIALAGQNPTPTPPTPPLKSLNNILLLYTMGQKPGWSKHILPFNVTTVRECVFPATNDVGVIALGDDKNIYRLFNNPQGPALVAVAESQAMPTRKQLGSPELWDILKDFLYFYIEGQDLPNFTYQWATDVSNFSTFAPATPLAVRTGRNIVNASGKQIVLRFTHSAIPAVGVTPLISYLKIAYTLSGRKS